MENLTYRGADAEREVEQLSYHEEGVGKYEASDVAHEGLPVEVPQLRDDRVDQKRGEEERDRDSDTDLVRILLPLLVLVGRRRVRGHAHQDADLLEGLLPVETVGPGGKLIQGGSQRAIPLKYKHILFVALRFEHVLGGVLRAPHALHHREQLTHAGDPLNIHRQLGPSEDQIGLGPTARQTGAIGPIARSEDLVSSAAFPQTGSQLAHAPAGLVPDDLVGAGRVHQLIVH